MAKTRSAETLMLKQLLKIQRRLKIESPWTGFPNIVHGVTRKFTLAEVTAMHTTPVQIVSDLPGVTIRPVNVVITASGTFDNFTNLVVEDTNGTPVAVATLTLAGVNAGIAILDTAALTRGAGLFDGVTAGKGLRVKTSGGTAASAGTYIRVHVLYELIEN